MAKEENKKRKILNRVTVRASLALAALILASGLTSCKPAGEKKIDHPKDPIRNESSEEPISEEVLYEEVPEEEENLEDKIKETLKEEAGKLNKEDLLKEYKKFIKDNKKWMSGQIRCVVDEEGNVISVLTSDSKYLVYTNDDGEKRIYKAIEEGEESIFVEEINTRFNFIKGSKGEQYLMISQEGGAELITDGSAFLCYTKGDKFYDNVTNKLIDVEEKIVTKTPGEVLEAFLANKNKAESIVPSLPNGAEKYYEGIKCENIENDPGMKKVLPTILEQFWAQRFNGEIYTIKNGNLVFYNGNKNGIDNQVSIVNKEDNLEMFFAFENLNKYFDGECEINYKTFEDFLAEAKIAEKEYEQYKGLEVEQINER